MDPPHQNLLRGSGLTPPIPSPSSPLHSSIPSSPRSPTPQEEQLFDAADNWDHLQPESPEQHQIQHLVPCSWSEFLELDPPPSGYYDYVDGLIVHCPHMGDREHNNLADSHSKVLASKDSELYIFVFPALEVLDKSSKTTWTTKEGSSGDGASSSDQRTVPQHGLRHPDLMILSTKRGSTGSIPPGQGSEKIQISYPYRKKVLAAVEITSISTRSVDLYTKWSAYSRSGVPMYIILDRGTATYPKRVIVGSLKPLSRSSEKMAHGDPDPSKRRTPLPEETPLYYRKIYESNEKVDCPYFSKLGMTVSQLLDEEGMSKLSREEQRKSADSKERADKAEKALTVEKNRADKAESEKKKAESEKKKAESEKKKAEDEKTKEKNRADKEKNRADKAESEKKKAEDEKTKEKNRADKAESEKKKAESEKKKAEKEAAKLLAKVKALEQKKGKDGGASSSSSSPAKSPKHKKSRSSHDK